MKNQTPNLDLIQQSGLSLIAAQQYYQKTEAKFDDGNTTQVEMEFAEEFLELAQRDFIDLTDCCAEPAFLIHARDLKIFTILRDPETGDISVFEALNVSGGLDELVPDDLFPANSNSGIDL